MDSTVVSNCFIDEYMKDANDAQLKVYLYLLRMLNANQAISVSSIADKFNCLAQKNLAVNTLKLRSRIREMVANVTHVGSAQYRVTNGMYQHIGIRVSQQAVALGDFHAAKPKRPVRSELMDVIPESDSYLAHY